MDYSIKCIHDRKILGHKVEHFDARLQEIINNTNLSNEEKEAKKAELINSLGLKNDCCRLMFISYPNLTARLIGDIQPK
jgi:DNA-directed RNA polymerase subunit N (RpoN/RPB10)